MHVASFVAIFVVFLVYVGSARKPALVGSSVFGREKDPASNAATELRLGKHTGLGGLDSAEFNSPGAVRISDQFCF